MTGLLQQRRYYWVNSKESQAHQSFCEYFSEVLTKKIITAASPLVFLCIGTPLIAGDTLGPQTGSRLVKKGIPNVFGTMENPVHAENIEFYRKVIKAVYHRPAIIAIDAAIGSKSQEGFITLRNGALKPGSGLGKRIPPIGNIEITGIFENIEKDASWHLSKNLSRIISDGIEDFIMNSLF
ncbi:MAG TPA: spore protease YyaC [Candidatus Scybalocola faecipullorum]|nr:spore protease YyaC [Candidatus Scybalocola faecipullorum]